MRLLIYLGIKLISNRMFDQKKAPLINQQSSSYQSLNLELGESLHEDKVYQNVGSLTAKMICLCISTFYFGYVLANIATFSTNTITTVYGAEAAKTSNWGIMMGVMPLGGIIGSGTARIIMQYATRKQFLLFVNLMALVVNGIIMVNNVYVLLICRIFQGVVAGFYMAITPIYINELVPRQIIGSFGAFTQLFILVGMVMTFGIGLILSKANASPIVFCRTMLLWNALLIILQSILLFINFIPESPNSLIKQNKTEQAKEVIGLFTVPSCVEANYKDKCMEVEVQMRKNQDAKEQEGEQKIRYSWKAYLLGFELPFMFQFTGVAAVATQAATIVQDIIPSIAEYVPLIINSANLVATLFSVWILAYFGRKTLVLYGNISLAIIDILIGIMFILSDWNPSGYIIFVLLNIFNFLFGLSLGPVIWMYVPEIIPAKVVPAATMMAWLSTSIGIIIIPFITEANGGNPFPVFFVFGGVTLALYFVNLSLAVETKDLSSLQISKLFAKVE